MAMVGTAGGSELTNLLSLLNAPEVVKDQIRDSVERRAAAEVAEKAANEALAETDSARRKHDAAERRAEASRTKLAEEREALAQERADWSISVTARETALAEKEKAVAETLAAADGRDKDTRRGKTALDRRIAAVSTQEQSLAKREGVLADFLKGAAKVAEKLSA